MSHAICKGCGRVVFDYDVDKQGRCCFCPLPAPKAPRRVVDREVVTLTTDDVATVNAEDLKA